jgi:D-sedoheptulose 7-phosphate isomerase
VESDSDYFLRLFEIVKEAEFTIDPMIRIMRSTVSNGGTIWILGNGGSASTAEHFETDLCFVKRNDLPNPIKVFALTANTSLITAIGNDLGYENVFAKQLQRKGEQGDLAIFISASGNSANLIAAHSEAIKKGIRTAAILGFDGGELKSKVDVVIHIESKFGEYGPVEDIHLALCHSLANRFAEVLCGSD